ncbi:MAG: hypothetical protein ACK4MZ_00585 [Thermomonas haemolytica]
MAMGADDRDGAFDHVSRYGAAFHSKISIIAIGGSDPCGTGGRHRVDAWRHRREWGASRRA